MKHCSHPLFLVVRYALLNRVRVTYAQWNFYPFSELGSQNLFWFPGGGTWISHEAEICPSQYPHHLHSQPRIQAHLGLRPNWNKLGLLTSRS